jgi:hypothetical protein
MKIFITRESVSFLSDGEVGVTYVTPDGEGTERNISE